MFRGLGTSRLTSLNFLPPTFAPAFAIDPPAWELCRQLCLEPAAAEAHRPLVCLDPALMPQVFHEAKRRNSCNQRPAITGTRMISTIILKWCKGKRVFVPQNSESYVLSSK